MRTTRRRTSFVGTAVAVALVATACGSSNDDVENADAADDTTEATAAPTSDAPDASTGDDTTTETTSNEPASGAPATPEPSDVKGEPVPVATGGEGYGQDPADPNLFHGSGGFTVDITECPGDWVNEQGISADEVSLFISLPKSGNLASYGSIASGLQSYFDYVNANGGVGGRDIVLDSSDDQFLPDLTKANVDEAIASGEYAAAVSLFGTASALAVRDTMNSECMPMLLTASSVSEMGDVENHPWTTGFGLDYFTEGQLWASWLETEFPDGATVAELTINTEGGKAWSSGLVKGIDESAGLELVDEQLHESAAPNIDNEMTTLEASGADVLVLSTVAGFCTQAIAALERSAWDPLVIVSGSCLAASQVFGPLIEQGLTGDGAVGLRYYQDPNDPSVADTEFAQIYQETVSSQGLDPTDSNIANGWWWGWYMALILNEAESYDGGLNRANIMVAARSVNQVYPLLIDGLTSRMAGLEDAYLNEGAQMFRYTVTDPAELGSWEPAGELVNNDGKTGTYAKVLASQDG